MAANVSEQDTNTHGTWLSHARTHIQRETKGRKPRQSRDALLYGQTNTAAAASSQSVGWSSFTLHAASCFCRGLRFGGSLERHCNSRMVFIPSSITRCDGRDIYGRDRRVEEDDVRQTGRGRCRKISVELHTSICRQTLLV